MAVSEPADGAAADRALDRAVESRYLYQIISTVSSTLDLERVLRAIVDLVTEAIDCHACFLYFVEPDAFPQYPAANGDTEPFRVDSSWDEPGWAERFGSAQPPPRRSLSEIATRAAA